MNAADLVVVGIPAPQGSKTRMPNGAMLDGKTPDARAALAEWRRAVADQARAWIAEHEQSPFDGPLHVTIAFRFSLPKSDPHRHAHTTKPDIDKLVRSTFDALKHGGLIADDARIYALTTIKTYARGQATVGARINVRDDTAIETALREKSKTAAREAMRAS